MKGLYTRSCTPGRCPGQFDGIEVERGKGRVFRQMRFFCPQIYRIHSMGRSQSLP